MQNDKILKLNCIETNAGWFVQMLDNNNYRSSHGLGWLLINGKDVKPTFSKNWAFVENKPTEIHQKLNAKIINQRFKLKDKSLASKLNIPEEIPASIDSDGDPILPEKINQYSSLYEYIYDKHIPEPELVKFEIVLWRKIDKIEEYAGTDKFNFTAFKTKWEHEGTIQLTPSDVHHYAVDEILYPDLILPTRPCFLTSKQSYDIVRWHIKQHINLRYAKITSDYDFCFQVEKVIQLPEEISYQIDVSKFGKKPKWETRLCNTRSIKVFEMTHSEENYKGYTVLPGFQGATHADLKKTIDKFLKELMIRINKPLVDCKHCNGVGLVEDKVNE